MPWRHTGGSRDIAPLILNLGTRWRWVVNITLWQLCPPPPRKEPQYPLNRMLGGPKSWCGYSGKREKCLAPSRIRNPDSAACRLAALPASLSPRLKIHNVLRGRCSLRNIVGFQSVTTMTTYSTTLLRSLSRDQRIRDSLSWKTY
jgi:hypothetical protein